MKERLKKMTNYFENHTGPDPVHFILTVMFYTVAKQTIPAISYFLDSFSV